MAKRTKIRIKSRNASASAPERAGRFTLQGGLSARSLEVLVTVARTGSMSAAAEQLGLTQPAVSQNISAIETNLGIMLFDRSVRPPALTLQATGLIQHATNILDSIRKFENALQLGHSAKLPVLKIGMLNSVATTIGPQIIQRLRDVAAELSVDSGFSATRFQALVQREFDFVVTADETQIPPDIQAIPFITEPMLLVAPESFAGRLENVARLSESLDLIRFGRDPALNARQDRALQALGVAPQRRYHLDTSEAVLQMVAAGSGWTILPALSAINAIRRKAPIRATVMPGETLDRTINVALRKGEGLAVAQQIYSAAVDALRTTFLPDVAKVLPKVASRIRIHKSAI